MHDLIIIGGGPAGSSAALAAAKAGLYVLLLEKESFPRYKPCGGALSNRSFSVLDFRLPEELCERAITGARVHFHNKMIEGHSRDPLFSLVTRSKFDKFLLQKANDAGCNTVTMRAEGYLEKEDHVEVITKRKKFKSRFLVDASGCQSRLRYCIQDGANKSQYGISVVTEIEDDDAKIQERLHNSLDFYFDVGSTGYGWIFPHKGYYSVGIWGQASNLNSLRTNMQNFLARVGFRGRYRLHGHKIPLGGINRRIARGRIILAGDSAGFADPITGEGIYYALRSGQIAARAILEQDPSDVSKIYEEMCKKDFGQDLENALHLLHSLNGSREMCLSALVERDDIMNNYIDVMAAKKTYKAFADWILPIIIHIYIDNFNKRANKIPKFIKVLLGRERINFKMIHNDGSVRRTGLYFEKDRIAKVIEGGLKNPTIVMAATQDAIIRIQRSNNPIAAMKRERQNGGVSIKAKSIGAEIKLNAVLSAAGVVRLLNHNFF